MNFLLTNYYHKIPNQKPVNFLQNTHNRQPIAHPWGWGMGAIYGIKPDLSSIFKAKIRQSTSDLFFIFIKKKYFRKLIASYLNE